MPATYTIAFGAPNQVLQFFGKNPQGVMRLTTLEAEATRFDFETANRWAASLAEMGFGVTVHTIMEQDYVLFARARRKGAEFIYVVGQSGGLFPMKDKMLPLQVVKHQHRDTTLAMFAKDFPDFEFKAEALKPKTP